MPAIEDKATTKVDVLVVGAGPAGLTTALLLARSGVTNIAIIDKRATRVFRGHASGFQPRSRELIQTLGFHHKLSAGSCQTVETAFWNASGDAGIARSSVGLELANVSPYNVTVQHQGRTEELFIKELSKRGYSVLRPFSFVHHELTDGEYPVKAYVQNIERGTTDIWRCKYLIDAEGAQSVARSLSDIKYSVDQWDEGWLVADVSVKTDFPDFRRKAPIRTPRGSIMWIARPNNTVRIYILMTPEDMKEVSHSKLSRKSDEPGENMISLSDILVRRVNTIMHPYTVEIKDIDWISQYVVAQKVMDSFIDRERILFVGDSCHSHSPKAAQGMNIGIQDAFNLAWKLSLVLKGLAVPKLLQSYSDERVHIAHQLIDFDKKFSAQFSPGANTSSTEAESLWSNFQGFASGITQQYPIGLLISDDRRRSWIDGNAVAPLTSGQRLLPMDLTRHIDGCPLSSLDDMPSNGQFYEVIFAGDISTEPRKSEFREAYQKLTSPKSAISKYNAVAPSDEGWDFEDIYTRDSNNQGKVIDLFVVHSADHLTIDLRPDFELWKYRFYEDKKGAEHLRHGVDPSGQIVVALMRPDGIVAVVCTAHEMLQQVPDYFSRFMAR